MESPFLVRLQQAELAAAERRTAARAEAERTTAQAEQDVAALEAAAPGLIAGAVAARRTELEQETRVEVEEIERELERLEADTVRSVDDPEARRRFDQAVELVVAAVLGETPVA